MSFEKPEQKPGGPPKAGNPDEAPEKKLARKPEKPRSATRQILEAKERLAAAESAILAEITRNGLTSGSLEIIARARTQAREQLWEAERRLKRSGAKRQEPPTFEIPEGSTELLESVVKERAVWSERLAEIKDIIRQETGLAEDPEDEDVLTPRGEMYLEILEVVEKEVELVSEKEGILRRVLSYDEASLKTSGPYTLEELEAARERADRWQKRYGDDDSGNPDKYRSQLRAANDQIHQIRESLKRQGLLERTPEERMDLRLNAYLPDAPHKAVAWYQGKAYRHTINGNPEWKEITDKDV